MLSKIKPQWLALCGIMLVPSAYAVDLVGVHDLALKNDPRLRAAEYRREATGENKTQAWSNFLPTLELNGSVSRGGAKTDIAGARVSDNDTDNESYGVSLIQSLYRQANYEVLDISRAQITQADADYEISFQGFLVRVADSYFIVLTLSDQKSLAIIIAIAQPAAPDSNTHNFE